MGEGDRVEGLNASVCVVSPSVSPAGSPPTDWGELVQSHDDRDAIQA